MPLSQRLFLILVLLLPTQLAFHFWPESAFVFGIRVDYLSPAVYLTDVLVALLLVAWMWEVGRAHAAHSGRKIDIDVGSWISHLSLRNPVSNFSLLTSGLFVYLVANSLLIAQNQPAALYKLIKLTELFLLGFYVSKNFQHLTSHFSFRPLLSLAVLYTSTIGIAQFFLQRTIGGPFWFLGERTFTVSTPGIATEIIAGQEYLRTYSIFSHPNSFAGFLLVACILLWPWNSFITRAAVVSAGIAFIFTFSQAAWFAAVLLAVLLLRKLRAAFAKLYTIGIPVLAVFLTVSVFWWHTLLPKTPEVVLRQELAVASLQMITHSPLFGVGLNNFVVQLPNFSSTPAVSWWLQPVHNVFLLVASETGIIGLAFLLWFLYLIFRKLIPDNWQTLGLSSGRRLITGNWKLMTGLLAILLTGSLDHYWFSLQQNQLLAALVLGLIFARKRR